MDTGDWEYCWQGAQQRRMRHCFYFPCLAVGLWLGPCPSSVSSYNTHDGINCQAKHLRLSGWQLYVQTMYYYLKASLIMSLRYWVPSPCRAPALSHRAGKFTTAIFTLSLLSGECQWNAATGTPDMSQWNPAMLTAKAASAQSVKYIFINKASAPFLRLAESMKLASPCFLSLHFYDICCPIIPHLNRKAQRAACIQQQQ